MGSMFFSDSDTVTMPGTSGSIQRNNSLDGFIANAVIGTRLFTKNKYYMDGEVYVGYNADKTSGSNTLSGPPFVNDLTRSLTYQWGVNVLPGRMITNDFSMFGLLGFTQTNFQSNAADGALEGYSGSKNIAFNGVQFGLGGELKLKYDISVRLQDGYIIYGNKSETTTSPGLAAPVAIKMDPYANQVLFSVIKRF